MNKLAARDEARNGKMSIGQLRALIAAARGTGRASSVNPAISLDYACGIYEAALARRPDDEVPAAWRHDPYSRNGSMKPTRDALIIANILRDCAP